MSTQPDGAVIPARRAAGSEQLSRYARTLERWLADLEGADGCSVCGVGPHVEHCPVPALRTAEEKMRFMAAIPMASLPPVHTSRSRRR